MATREATVTKISEARDPFDFPVATDYVEYSGVKYYFRELSVGETDEAREGAMIENTLDGRLMTRLMIVTSSTEPKIADLETLGKLPQRLYSAVVDCVNDLNDPETLAKKRDDGKGKSSQPTT